MMHRPSWTVTLSAAALVAGSLAVGATSLPQAEGQLSSTLARAGARVEEFFARAQSLVCTETVSMQPLSSTFSAEGFGRTVQSELRVSWDPGLGGPATEANTVRQVMKGARRISAVARHRNKTRPRHSRYRCCCRNSRSGSNFPRPARHGSTVARPG
jgi:hypothetical protein